MKLEPYDILMHKNSNNIIHKLIRHVLGSEYHHVSLLLDDFHTADINYKNPLQIMHLNKKLKQFDGYRIPDLTTMQKEKMINFIQKTLNSKYDLREIINYFGFGLNDSKDRWICISWCDDLLAYSGIKIVEDIYVYSFEDLIDKYGLVRV